MVRKSLSALILRVRPARIGRFAPAGPTQSDSSSLTSERFLFAFAGGGFDPAEDIAGITVNRWGHGYSYRYRPGFDSGYEGNEFPHIVGRQRLGRITIANCDAGASASIRAAIDQAHRAIAEIDS